MTTLAVPYYGNLYHGSTGYEHVYFIVSYDTTTDCPNDVRLSVWDEKQNPELTRITSYNVCYTKLLRLALAVMALVYWTHRENIGRLARGEEKSWLKKKHEEKADA